MEKKPAKAKITFDGVATIEVELTDWQNELIRQGFVGGMSIKEEPAEKEVDGL